MVQSNIKNTVNRWVWSSRQWQHCEGLLTEIRNSAVAWKFRWGREKGKTGDKNDIEQTRSNDEVLAVVLFMEKLETA